MFINANLFRIQFQDGKTCHCSRTQVIKAKGTLKSQSGMKKTQQSLQNWNSVWNLGASWLIAAGAYIGFCSMKWLGVSLLPLDGIASPSQVTPPQFVKFPQQFANTHLYSWLERGTVRVKCLSQEHNTVSLARTQSGDERTNHGAIMPKQLIVNKKMWISH